MSELVKFAMTADCDVVDAGHNGITKAQLIDALSPLPDDAAILIESDPDVDTLRDIRFVELNKDNGDGQGFYATLVGPFPDDLVEAAKERKAKQGK